MPLGRPLFVPCDVATSRLTPRQVNASLFGEFIEVNYVLSTHSSRAAQFPSGRRRSKPTEFRVARRRSPTSPFSLASRVAPHNSHLAGRLFLPENARLCGARLPGCRRVYGSGELGH